mmetsp:Transcript_6533/g.11686  ORF Transcript_6533/g.11686 Transcript_6533/m.11686 type:complete len:93 (+) Transcript_6533:304-582(+)
MILSNAHIFRVCWVNFNSTAFVLVEVPMLFFVFRLAIARFNRFASVFKAFTANLDPLVGKHVDFLQTRTFTTPLNTKGIVLFPVSHTPLPVF